MAMEIGVLARQNHQIGVQLELWANRALAGERLTGCQAQVLLYILRHEDSGASLTAIHHAYGYSKASLSGLIKQLREKGYVRVEPCREDDRRKLLYGTEKGRQLLEAMHAADLKAQVWLQQTFTPAELTALEHLQGKLLRSLIQLNTSNPKKEASAYAKSDASTQAV